MVETRRLIALAGSAKSRLELPEGDLVVGLSGGADSAALAWLCVDLGRRTRALHVNHGLPFSDRLESAARAIAHQLGLDLQIVGVELPEGASPEGRARRARYAVFEQVQGEALLTAHTVDDDGETVLLNLIRGTGPRGLGGIPYHRPPSVYRPALELRRAETRELAQLAGLDFFDDPMNDDPHLARNWIRGVIVPLLETANTKLIETLHRTARLLRFELDHLVEAAGSFRPILAETSAKAPRGVLLTISPALAGRVMMSMVEHVLGSSAVTEARIARMWSVLSGETARQELGGGAIVEMEGPMLVVGLETAPDPVSEVSLTSGVHRVGQLEYEVRSTREQCRVLPLSIWAAVFPVGTDLVVRPDGVVTANGREAWVPGEKRLPVAWYRPGEVGYLLVTAREGTGWTSSR